MANSDIEEIKSRINIVDFIGQYLRLQKAGANWKANCPFHNEKTPSFMVHEEKQIWHCFGCGKGGDVFGFLMEMDALDFKEALKVLADKAGVELKQYKHEKEQATDKNKILEILELAAKFYETQLWKGMGKDKILKYLRGRALEDETIKGFRLGYAPPGWRNLITFLTSRGYKIEDIARTGLLVQKMQENQKSIRQLADKNQNEIENLNNNVTGYKLQDTGCYDRFRDRIIFPITDLAGKAIGFSARVAPGGDESQAKYVNTPETIVYHKSKVLYGIDKAKREMKEKDEAVLVEGNMDVIAAHQAGIQNTIAVSGTALAPEQLEIIKRYAQNLKMFFDMDEAGKAAARRSAEMALQKGLNVYIIESSEGKDAADLVSKDPQMFLKSVAEAQPAMEYFFHAIFSGFDRNDSIKKKEIARAGLNLISNISNEIEKSHWIKKMAEALEVDYKLLTDALIKSERRKNRPVSELREEEKGVARGGRIETIITSIIGLMLSFPEVWKKAAAGQYKEKNLSENNYYQILLEKGELSNFEISRLLVMMDDEELKKYFSSLSFENRYRFGEKGDVDEFDSEKALKQFELYVVELKRETLKKKLGEILADIKKAEAKGSKAEKKILIDEFNKLAKDLK